MFIQKIPIFQSGTVLTQEMMESMKSYAINMGQISYHGYTDGILKGCTISVNEDMLVINTGIILYAGKPIFLQDPVEITYQHTNTCKILVVRVGEEEKNHDYVMRRVDIILLGEQELNSKDIELARFTLQEGAKLRNQYRDFFDLSTIYNTLCIAYTKWASYEKESISYEILYKFAQEAVKINEINEIDQNFVQLILSENGETLPRGIIENYILWRLKKSVVGCSTFELYKGLAECLKQIQNKMQESNRRPSLNRRLIID